MSFYLRLTALPEIKSVIINLKDSSPGHGEINSRIIKESSEIISSFLVLIINKSFQDGVFPKSLEIARITSIFENGDNSLPLNFRPISILSCFSRIIEKAMALRLSNYLPKLSLLNSCQHGFRPSYSTELAVHHLCQSMYHALNIKLFQVTVF